MENASKALLIAGGVLLAILIISLLMLTVNKISSFNTAREETVRTEQILKFNGQYEAFNKYNLLGTEIITAFNKVIDNNKKNPNTKISMELRFIESVSGGVAEEMTKYTKNNVLEQASQTNQASSEQVSSSRGMRINSNGAKDNATKTKLSSGYKINRAADNATGLAISEKMRSQIRGLSRVATYSEPITEQSYSDETFNSLKSEDNKAKLYYCDVIGYDSEGRINYISFKEMTEAQKDCVKGIDENITSAESQIRDTDMATEMTEYIK